jgi:acyl-CoA thioesterase-2
MAAFSSRRVVAIKRQPIFTCRRRSRLQQGLEHPERNAAGAATDALPDIRDLVAQSGTIPPEQKRWFATPLPIEFRAVNPHDLMSSDATAPDTKFWFRAIDALPDDPVLHHCVLAFASDFYLLRTATQPHGIPFPSPRLRCTIDHAMWFHRPFASMTGCRATCPSPGSVACATDLRSQWRWSSVAQEGLMRVRVILNHLDSSLPKGEGRGR